MSDASEPSAGFVEIRCARCGEPMRVADAHLRDTVACPGCDADVEPWRATVVPVDRAEGGMAPGSAPGTLRSGVRPDGPVGVDPGSPQKRTKKKRQPDIRKLAKAQRWMILIVLLGLVMQLTPPLLIPAIGPVRSFLIVWGILYLGLYVLMVIGTVLLLRAQGNGLPMVIACGILALFPCVSLILLLLVNMSATRTLRRAGLRVGFMGVKEEHVERVCNPALCSGCGYDLTGNVTGRCSECGRVVED